MGSLADFDLARLSADFGCKVFVETGTGKGDSLAFAAAAGFEQLFSIEIMHALALEVAIRHAKDHRITIIHGKSERGLAEALAEVVPETPVLFWLDARFPGADYGLKPYDGEKNPALRWPLLSELRVLAQTRSLHRDVILINEWRLYEQGPYDHGPAPDLQRADLAGQDGSLVETILGATHRLERLTRKGGTLCAFPRE